MIPLIGMDTESITRIAEIVNTHGIKGELKISPLTDDPDIFSRESRVIAFSDGKPGFYSIVKARPFKKYYWLILLDEIRDLDAARKMKGQGIYVEDEKLRPLEEDEFFVHDLLNAEVYSVDDRYLGIVTDYFEAGPQGVCEVSKDSEKFLFPATREVIREIFPSDKIIIRLLPGLMELNK